MLMLNVCDKHGNGTLEFRLSKDIIEDIKKDAIINSNDIAFVNFKFEDKKDTYLIYKSTFIHNNLSTNYYVKNELYEDEQVTNFWNKYMDRICLACVRDYENRHKIILTKNIIEPYTMF